MSELAPSLEGILKTLEAVSYIATAVAIAFIAYEAHISSKRYKEEIIRRRKESTFEFFALFRDGMRKNHLTIRSKYKLSIGDILSDNQAIEIRNDEQARDTVIDTLYKMERIALGIKYNIYDFDTIFDLSRVQFMSMYAIYSAYIVEARKDTPRAYFELEELIKRIHKLSESRGYPRSKAYANFLSAR